MMYCRCYRYVTFPVYKLSSENHTDPGLILTPGPGLLRLCTLITAKQICFLCRSDNSFMVLLGNSFLGHFLVHCKHTNFEPLHSDYLRNRKFIRKIFVSLRTILRRLDMWPVNE